MTNIDNVTDEQIEALAANAAATGDQDMVLLCELALVRDRVALEACVEAISDAEAAQS